MRRLLLPALLLLPLLACATEVITQVHAEGDDLGSTADAAGATDAPSAEDAAAPRDADTQDAPPHDAPPDTPPPDPADASAEPDATEPDASAEPDAPDEPDATAEPDAPDLLPGEGDACQVSARAGVCLRTADCDGGRQPVPGHCPGPAEVQCCVEPPDVDPGTCDPDAHPTPNADLTAPPGLGGCPDGMARIGAACVDRWEAFVVEVLDDGTTLPWSPYFNPEARRVRAVSAPGAVPQSYISGAQAADACQEAGKRLCTDAEWLRACQGPSAWTYPYGPTLQPGVCNDARSPHPVVEYFGTSADWIWSELNHPCIGQQHDTVARTGAYAGCVTPEGAFDLMGNLHEWTADPDGTFRGGFYVDTSRNGPGCLYRTTAHDRSHHDYSTGFRCCAP